MLSKSLWGGYSLADPDDKVKERFIRRYGYPPAKVWRDGSIVHAGPIVPSASRLDGDVFCADPEEGTPWYVWNDGEASGPFETEGAAKEDFDGAEDEEPELESEGAEDEKEDTTTTSRLQHR